MTVLTPVSSAPSSVAPRNKYRLQLGEIVADGVINCHYNVQLNKFRPFYLLNFLLEYSKDIWNKRNL